MQQRATKVTQITSTAGVCGARGIGLRESVCAAQTAATWGTHDDVESAP